MTAIKEPAAKAAPEKPSFLKSKKGMIVILLLLVVAGGAYKFVLAPKAPAPIAGGDIVPLDASTLNLTGGHYLKVAVAVQLIEGKATSADFNTSKAAELVLNEFSDRSVTSLSTNPARLKMTADLKARMKHAYPGEVFDVFVTQFVMQ